MQLEPWARKANVGAWALGSAFIVAFLAMSDLTQTERIWRELWWTVGLLLAPRYILWVYRVCGMHR